MKTPLLRPLVILAAGVTFFWHTSAQVISPEQHFGFTPGSDRNLFTYESLINYLKILDSASDRLELREIGRSPMGRPMFIAFISDAGNISRLEELKLVNRKLALQPDLPEQEKEALVKEGRVFVLGTLSMHSTEVAPSQAAATIAYDLVTTDDPVKLEWLRNTVYMMVPNHNPDGMDMVVDHYNKYKGTKYEGSTMPGIYHKYVGHDNNRDFITLTQTDTRAISAIYSTEWFPQVMVEKHQMGSSGTRYFIPPNHDPIAENVDAGIWNWMGIFGANMMKDMTADGLAGISQHFLFDDYWPGSTETCIWKNVIGMLTEGASAKVATPVYIEPTELKVDGKGLAEYKKSVNMPLPWEGGWWRLSDLFRYEVSSTYSILKTASENRADILRFRNDICIKEIEKGKTLPPFYYVFQEDQHDQSELAGMVNLLVDHGVRVYRTKSPVNINNQLFDKGSIVVPLAQPFRAFIKEVLEKQQYPVRHYTPGGEVIKPYDIASWSLPLHFGVNAVEVDVRSDELENSLEEVHTPFKLTRDRPGTYAAVLFPAECNESYRAAFMAMASGIQVERLDQDLAFDGRTFSRGSFLIRSNVKDHGVPDLLLSDLAVSPKYMVSLPDMKSIKISLPRIGLVETYFHDMDAGWTRFVFDQYGIPYKVIRPGDIEKTKLSDNFDLLVFPDMPKSVLMEGKYGEEDDYYVVDYPPEFKKGIGKEGLKNLMQFTENGGLVIAWGESVSLFEGVLTVTHDKEDEEFRLPFADASKDLAKKGLYCPGSLVRMKITPGHPVTLGMEDEIGIFFRGRPVFSTSVPRLDMDRRVLGVIPEDDILMSGYVEKEELLGNKPELIWMKKGRGQFVFFGFGPQFRASTHVSYKLLFNAILLKGG
jgi:hypothetical protein